MEAAVSNTSDGRKVSDLLYQVLAVAEHAIGGESEGQKLKHCRRQVVQRPVEQPNETALGHYLPSTYKGRDESMSIGQH
jgi:hypothetical protein